MQPDPISVSLPGADLGNLPQPLWHFITTFIPNIGFYLQEFFGLIIGLSLVLSLFLIVATIYATERLKVLRRKEAAIHEAKVEESFETTSEGGDKVLRTQWEDVVRHINSPTENDWKQAIIEADMILDELLTKMGYRGESVGEKLKRVEPGDVKSLNEAWEGHKVRNQIAHEPGFTLNKIEAQRAFQMYKKVFDEFYYI